MTLGPSKSFSAEVSLAVSAQVQVGDRRRHELLYSEVEAWGLMWERGGLFNCLKGGIAKGFLKEPCLLIKFGWSGCTHGSWLGGGGKGFVWGDGRRTGLRCMV